MYFVIRSLVTSSPILVYGGEIGCLILTREIRGYTLPGIVVFGERGNSVEIWLCDP
jgi:hypothetical protein